MSVSQNFPNIVPSLSLNFALTKALDPKITFSRASTATYYGTQTAKAEENLLLNSVLSGAVAGTPGTTPTNWGLAASGGFINSVVVGADGLSNVITLSATSARQILDQTRSVIANAVYQAQITVVSNADNLQISQILSWVSPPSGATTAYFINGVSAASTDVPSANSLIVAQLTVSSTAGNATFRFGIGAGGNATGTVAFTRPQLEQRSAVTAYTPTTTQPITNYIPVLQTASANVARFDHNPLTFESLGLLVEESRTNLLTYSEDFANAAWDKVRSSISANTIVAPDGTLTGDLLVENTDNNSHVFLRDLTLTAGTSYTFSMVFKSSNRNVFIETRFAGNWSAYVSARFNLSTGTVDAGTGTITPVGNGWYRCSITATFGASTTTGGFAVYIASGSSVSYTGDGYSGIYIWGAQLEAGAFPTSYIKTEASQVTRSTDVAEMTGTNFSSWYQQGEGTLYTESSVPAFSASSVLQATTASFSDGSSANVIRTRGFSLGNGSFVWDAVVRANNVSQVDTDERTFSTVNQVVKNCIAYKFNDFANSVNAQTVSTDTSGVVPVVTRFSIGSLAGSADINAQHIRKIAYYPIRISNTQVQALTS